MTIDEVLQITARGEIPPRDDRIWIFVEFFPDRKSEWSTHNIGVVEAREKLDTVRADMWDYVAHSSEGGKHV